MKDNSKKIFHSIRLKLFFIICITLSLIILALIILANFGIERYYLYSKQKKLLETYDIINDYYNNGEDIDISLELEKIAINNNFDILVKSENDISVYSLNRDFFSMIKDAKEKKDGKNIYSEENISITRFKDTQNGLYFIFMDSKLDNGYLLYIRMPESSMIENTKISINFITSIGIITIFASAIGALIISTKFTKPIKELSNIADSMSKLDFSKKYELKDSNDELNNLGLSINKLSVELETTINKLKKNNTELEKDIERKSKIDEMRKQFISDVSHELKTPISLIQGYAEGLLENVNSDEENRKFYAEVIMDEANKMDTLVKRLLELMKLEYGKMEFNNKEFNVVELIKEEVRKCKIILEEKNVKLEIVSDDIVNVNADDFYISQIIVNYLTNAVKNVKDVNGKKEIRIEVKRSPNNKIRITVFNTGDNIKEDDLDRIWNRFYKVDESRNRDNGGTGIGLSIVKAIMNNYNNSFGVENKPNGVEFYFELNTTAK